MECQMKITTCGNNLNRVLSRCALFLKLKYSEVGSSPNLYSHASVAESHRLAFMIIAQNSRRRNTILNLFNLTGAFQFRFWMSRKCRTWTCLIQDVVKLVTDVFCFTHMWIHESIIKDQMRAYWIIHSLIEQTSSANADNTIITSQNPSFDEKDAGFLCRCIGVA